VLEDCSPRWIVTKPSDMFELCNRSGVRTGTTTFATLDWKQECTALHGPNLFVVPSWKAFHSEGAQWQRRPRDFETILSRVIHLTVRHGILP
jgi:hypothetical protein